ncbi:chorismate mutase [Micrococcus sp. 2A]|uniref:chorismate mutase n=1 Tax=Micrococcus TaxID=1269 RepID=UPI0020045507|nr:MULTISPECIES: chorismate mutase [unclassified Micrococcus]MCK6095769.1 chorismate mutase [Micrococcus sp. EYE_212]MCK6172498.1 chorismate mutase [Micrococcus sp. EYE_162]
MSADYDPHASSLDASTDPAVLDELFAIRGSIDNIDASLVYLLAERFKFTQRVGRLKAEHDLPPSDPGREAAQIERLQRLAHDAELEPAFAQKFLNFVIAEVIRHHRAIAAGEDVGPRTGTVPVVRQDAARDADGGARA